MEVNKRKVGAFYEELAADYLISQGVMILERNYRNRRGEIDLLGMTADGGLDFWIFMRCCVFFRLFFGNLHFTLPGKFDMCAWENDLGEQNGYKMA